MGKRAMPGNKADAEHFSQSMFRHHTNFENARDAYFPHLKPVEEGRRKRSQRKRDKKILKEYNKDVGVWRKDPSAVYDGGRRRRTRKYKHAGMRTRKNKLAGKRTNRKTRGRK
jgi:hypothetical protein